MFNEEDYRSILHRIKEHHKFVVYSRIAKENEPHVLWRHDVDMSPRNAARIAEIESEEDVQSTYFWHLHSVFYNLFDEDTARNVDSILNNGHAIGLHFDPAFYIKRKRFIDMIEIERDIIFETFGAKPMAISFHNPSFLDQVPDDGALFGMINTDSKYIRENYHYYSDSNHVMNPGFLVDSYQRLHVLTHPEWWWGVEISHLEKVNRILSDRRDIQQIYYKDILRRVYDK